VASGQVLYVIDPDRYEAQLAAARARLSRAEAAFGCMRAAPWARWCRCAR